jgi:hypothetical protein
MTGLSVGAPFFPGGYGQPLAHGTDRKLKGQLARRAHPFGATSPFFNSNVRNKSYVPVT